MDGFLVQVTDVGAVSSIRGALASAEKILGIWSNPLPSPLDNEWGVFLLDVLIWLGIAAAVAFGMDRILKVITRKTKTTLDDTILGIIRTPILLIIFAFGAVQSLGALHKYIHEGTRESVWSLYQVILVLVIFYLAYKLFKEILLHYGRLIAERTESKIDDVLMPVLEKMGIVVIGLVAVGYILSVLHVDLTMFVAGGVVVSMVLAFAAQETLSNFFSGMFILLDRPFAEGDTVILSDGDWCEIRSIGLRTTRLYRFSDATIVTLPNNKMINDKITRVTNVQDPAKVTVTVGVAYGSDLAKAREAISKAIRAMPYSLLTDKSKEPLILLDQMADSSLLFKVVVWLNDSGKRIAAADRLTEEVYHRLKEAGVEIPVTQRLVHVKKADD
jgi:small-conductance mechanosensitive channel